MDDNNNKIILPNGTPGHVLTQDNLVLEQVGKAYDALMPADFDYSHNPSNYEMDAMKFKNPKQVNELKYIIKDILSGDQKAAHDERYSYLNFKQIKTAIEWIQNNSFDESLQNLLISQPWRLVYKIKPPTPEEFLTSKYIGAMADSLWLPVKKNFLEFFDPMKPYRNAYLNPSIGSGKPLPYSEICKGCLRIIDIEDDNGNLYHIPKNDRIKIIVEGKKYNIYAKELEKFSSKKVNWYRKSILIKYMKNYVVGNFKELKFTGKTYNDLIEFFKNIKEDFYKENSIYVQKHHIIPKSEGGTDDNSNLISLPYKFHMMAHYLRGKEAEASGNKKAAFANYKAVLYALGENSVPKSIKDFSSKIDFVVESLQKRNALEKQTIWITDGIISKKIFDFEEIPEGWKKGRTFKNPSSKKWMNKDGKNFYVETNEVNEYLMNGFSLGMFKTEKMKNADRSSYSTLGTVWVNKDGKNKSIKKELLESYLNNGWKKGHIFKNTETAKTRRMYNPQTGKIRATKVHLIEKYLSKGWILGGKQ
jgi:hypothetical protein